MLYPASKIDSGNPHQTAERDFPEALLRLYTLNAMVMVNVLDLVAEYRRQFVFAVHQRHQSGADVNMPAGQRKGIHKIHIRNVVKLVGQFAMSPSRHLGPYAAHVILHQFILLLLF